MEPGIAAARAAARAISARSSDCTSSLRPSHGRRRHPMASATTDISWSLCLFPLIRQSDLSKARSPLYLPLDSSLLSQASASRLPPKLPA